MSRFIDSVSSIQGQITSASPRPRETVENPSWDQIESVIRRLDAFAYTAVELHRRGDCPEEVFCIIGGAGRWYLVDSVMRWEFNDPTRGEEKVVIWQDMDMECKSRNLVCDVEKVIRISRRFFESGSFEELNEECSLGTESRD